MRWLLLAAIVSFLSIEFAYAHSPYTKDIKTIAVDGKAITVQRLFGDGIFFADPVSLQLKNEAGGVVAYTPVGRAVSSFCRSKFFCWGFVFPNSYPWPLAYKLSPPTANWNASKTHEGYPETDRKGQGYGFERTFNPLMSLIGSFMLIKDYFIWYSILFSPFLLSPLVQAANKKALKVALSKSARFVVSALNIAAQSVLWVFALSVIFFGRLYAGLPLGSTFLIVFLASFSVKYFRLKKKRLAPTL